MVQTKVMKGGKLLLVFGVLGLLLRSATSIAQTEATPEKHYPDPRTYFRSGDDVLNFTDPSKSLPLYRLWQSLRAHFPPGHIIAEKQIGTFAAESVQWHQQQRGFGGMTVDPDEPAQAQFHVKGQTWNLFRESKLLALMFEGGPKRPTDVYTLRNSAGRIQGWIARTEGFPKTVASEEWYLSFPVSRHDQANVLFVNEWTRVFQPILAQSPSLHLFGKFDALAHHPAWVFGQVEKPHDGAHGWDEAFVEGYWLHSTSDHVSEMILGDVIGFLDSAVERMSQKGRSTEKIQTLRWIRNLKQHLPEVTQDSEAVSLLMQTVFLAMADKDPAVSTAAVRILAQIPEIFSEDGKKILLSILKVRNIFRLVKKLGGETQLFHVEFAEEAMPSLDFNPEVLGPVLAEVAPIVIGRDFMSRAATAELTAPTIGQRMQGLEIARSLRFPLPDDVELNVISVAIAPRSALSRRGWESSIQFDWITERNLQYDAVRLLLEKREGLSEVGRELFDGAVRENAKLRDLVRDVVRSGVVCEKMLKKHR